MFASIPTFAEYYNEASANKDGEECLKVLNLIFTGQLGIESIVKQDITKYLYGF